MAETVTVEQATTEAAPQQAERTFTQSELNSIIEGRLKKESAKYSDYEELKTKASKFDEMTEANKSELQKANEKAIALQAKIDEMTKAKEVTEIRNKVASETGIPVNLLTGENEDACREQAAGILAFAKPNAYPTVKDGGEAIAPTSNSTRDMFASFLSSNLHK